jgi:hypothetical protein
MKVKMNSLEKLRSEMNLRNIQIQQFRVKSGAIEFDCLYHLSGNSSTLVLTSRGKEPKFFKFIVAPDSTIEGSIEPEIYWELVKVLRIDGRSGNKLIPKEFLSNIDNCLPTEVDINRIPNPATIVQIHHDIEERDKPYFDGWIVWSMESGRKPTSENLYKTRVILGTEAESFSKNLNTSSAWCATPTGKSFRI